MHIENTMVSGIGKDFTVVADPYFILPAQPVDFNGRPVYKGEEYYIFGDVYVHIEDVQEYLQDERLDVECYDLLIKLIEIYHDNYPIIM